MSNSQRSQPGPWKGQHGPRILTEAQRARKREKDRITKREEKLKIQNKIQTLEKTNVMSSKRIEELEAQVRALLQSCRCSGDSCASCETAYNHSSALQMSFETTSQYVAHGREGSSTSSETMQADPYLRSRQIRSLSDSTISSDTGMHYFSVEHSDHSSYGVHDHGHDHKSLPYHLHPRQKSSSDIVLSPKSRFPRLLAPIAPSLSPGGMDQDPLDLPYI